MGQLIDGEWTTRRGFADEDGVFRREPVSLRDRVAPEDATSGRHRLYVSYACPWAHRCLIVRALRGLTPHVPVSVVHWFMGADGWTFAEGEGVVPDPDGAALLRDVYLRHDPKFTGKVTVPILWDTQDKRIVNNESREIIRMFDTSFLGLGDPDVNLAPEPVQHTIDAVIDAIYEPINNGVYRTGFARSQRAYEEAVGELFDALDHWNTVLADQRFLVGDQMTESDI